MRILPVLGFMVVSLLAWTDIGATAESSCAKLPEGSISRMECERNARLRQAQDRTKQGVAVESPPSVSRPLVPSVTPPRSQGTDFGREAGRRICDAYGVTGNEWTGCVSYYQQKPPCPRPAEGESARGWETCISEAVLEAKRRVAEATQRLAEQRRQAELEERKVRALEEQAKAQRDQARAQEGIAWGLNRPPACTTFLVAPGVTRTICDGGIQIVPK